jgi:hypothetical protein
MPNIYMTAQRILSCFKIVVGSISLLLLSPASVWAQEASVDPPEIKIQPIVGFSSINQAVGTIIGVVFFGAALLAFFYIVQGALKYVSAGDNAANTQAARQTIQNAVIGLFIIGVVYLIFKVTVSLIPGLGTFFK